MTFFFFLKIQYTDLGFEFFAGASHFFRGGKIFTEKLQPCCNQLCVCVCVCYLHVHRPSKKVAPNWCLSPCVLTEKSLSQVPLSSQTPSWTAGRSIKLQVAFSDSHDWCME